MHLYGPYHRKERGCFDLIVAVNGLDNNGREHVGDRHAGQDGKRRSDYEFLIY
jgi:hypothetical protein